ncbi:MAG: endonuclease III [Clostridia bacterium]
MKTKDKAVIIYNNLAIMHPQARCELNFTSSFELLVAVILSAQCTDKRVNIITDKLFKVYNKPSDFAVLELEEIKKYIYSCGFYQNKGNNIIATSKMLVENYNSEVPTDFEELVKLPGVGRKTASVMLSVAFNKPAMPVDTHVNRVSKRLGLSKGKNVDIVEEDLKRIIPIEKWNNFHHYMIFQGRYICKSQNPMCNKCLLTDVCKYYKDIEGEKK